MPAFHTMTADEIKRVAEQMSRDQQPALWGKIDVLTAQLAESQAREAHMRTEMEKIADWHGSWGPFPENNEAWRSMVVVTARQATKLPHDASALNARLKAERERCATEADAWVFGPTPLIAVCRCYVASKLGDEVDVPEELLK